MRLAAVVLLLSMAGSKVAAGLTEGDAQKSGEQKNSVVRMVPENGAEEVCIDTHLQLTMTDLDQSASFW